MENKEITTLEQAREQHNAEQAQEQHNAFVLSMENKTFSELNLQQQSYLHNEYNKLYMQLVEDKEKKIDNLLPYEKLKAQEKANKERFAAEKAAFIEQENNKTEEEKQIDKMIAAIVDNALKKHSLL